MQCKTFCSFPITTHWHICFWFSFFFLTEFKKTKPWGASLLLSTGWCYNEDGRSLLERERWGCVVMHLMRPIRVPPPRWGESSLLEHTKAKPALDASLITPEQTVRINAKHLSEPPNRDFVASLGKCIQKTQFDLLRVRYLKVEAWYCFSELKWSDQQERKHLMADWTRLDVIKSVSGQLAPRCSISKLLTEVKIYSSEWKLRCKWNINALDRPDTGSACLNTYSFSNSVCKIIETVTLSCKSSSAAYST